MRTFVIFLNKWQQWADQHQRGSILQLDQAPFLEGFATKASERLLSSEYSMVSSPYRMFERLCNDETFTEEEELPHYRAFWRLPSIDQSKHPCTTYDAILNITPGVQIRTVLVQTGSTLVPSKLDTPLLDVENKATITESAHSLEWNTYVHGAQLCGRFNFLRLLKLMMSHVLRSFRSAGRRHTLHHCGGDVGYCRLCRAL
jgi:hypothetical protein